MRADTGGGGGRILIDPDSLRTAAGRLKGIAGDLQLIESVLSDVGYPSMPPGTYAVVQPAVSSSVYSISSELGPLTDTPTELTRRAFWAEYADRMMSGYVLTGTAKTEFEQWLADGTLLKYASPDEARAAGMELAKVSGDFRKDPRLLLALAVDLKGAETATDQDVREAFSAGFVNQFGAKNMELVPRVIQAMESSRALSSMYSGADMRALGDVARTWEEQGVTLQDLHVDPLKDLLAPFSIALANATYSGQVTRTVEQGIANDDDWATAALLSQGGKFGTQFLVDCFRSGVVNKIVRDSPYYEAGSLEQPPRAEPYNLGWSSDHALPGDTKQIIMEALARNPQAAHLALTQSLSDLNLTVADEYNQRSPVDNPITLLYQYGHFGDHGAGLGHAFVSGEDYAYGKGESGSMTLRMINEVVGHNRSDMGAVTDSLGAAISAHHVGDLHTSASQFANDGGADWDPDGDGLPGEANGNVIGLSHVQEINLLQHLIDAPDARHSLMQGVTAYQANLARMHAGGASDDWVKQLGSFDGLLNSADEQSNLNSYAEAVQRQQDISTALDHVTSLLPLPKGVDIAVSDVKDLVTAHYGPHGDSPSTKSLVFHEQLMARLDTTVISATATAHPEILAHVPQDLAQLQSQGGLSFHVSSFLDSSGHIRPYGQMTTAQQQTFSWWASHTPTIDKVVHDPLQTAQVAFGVHDADQQGPPAVP